MKRSEYEINKIIPGVYRDVILDVLKHYPELQTVRIRFVLKEQHPVPYGTMPDIASILRKKAKRTYTVSLLEKAQPPLEQALFRNLTRDMQKGVLAHELVHVLQFHAHSSLGLLKYVWGFASGSLKREMEIAADRGAVEHGFGKELYEHAAYIRTIPGYMQSRPGIHTDYMEPEEILAYTEALQTARKNAEN